MALKTDLRSPDDKKFKGHTEDVSTDFTKFKAKQIIPAFMFFNKLKDKNLLPTVKMMRDKLIKKNK